MVLLLKLKFSLSLVKKHRESYGTDKSSFAFASLGKSKPMLCFFRVITMGVSYTYLTLPVLCSKDEMSFSFQFLIIFSCTYQLYCL